MSALPTPIRIDPLFDDPSLVMHCVRAGAPYRLQSVIDLGYENAGENPDPWFRAYWVVPGKTFLPEAEALLHDARLVEAAGQLFGARVVRPQAVMANLMGPMPAGAAHVDLPYFRGAPARDHPAELLYAMGRSGLCERWAIRVASALCWFHLGADGGFEYWPDGPGAPSRLEAMPLWNAALVSDNDRMRHRTREVGPASERLPRGRLRRSARLHAHSDGGWEICDGAEGVVRWPFERIRLSILWKAHVFADAQAAATVDEGSDDLDPATIARVFADGAKRQGATLPSTRDPRTDRSWIRAVCALYPAR